MKNIWFLFYKNLVEKYKISHALKKIWGFPGDSDSKESACNAGDPGGRSPGEGNGNPLHYSCLANPMDGGAWRATVHKATKSLTQLSDFTHLKDFMDLIWGSKCYVWNVYFSPLIILLLV